MFMKVMISEVTYEEVASYRVCYHQSPSLTDYCVASQPYYCVASQPGWLLCLLVVKVHTHQPKEDILVSLYRELHYLSVTWVLWELEMGIFGLCVFVNYQPLFLTADSLSLSLSLSLSRSLSLLLAHSLQARQGGMAEGTGQCSQPGIQPGDGME